MASHVAPTGEPGPSGASQRQDFAGAFSAADHARQHVGNNYSTSNYHYTVRKRKSDDTLHDNQRDQAFLDSAADGQLQRLKHLYRLGVDIDYVDKDGLTALHHAALSGFQDVVEYLWDIGCNVNAHSVNHGTPLCLAALKGRERIVKLLVDDRRRAKIQLKGAMNGSPLHCAAHSGHVPTIQALSDNGARLDARAMVCISDWADHGDEVQRLYIPMFTIDQVVADFSPLLFAIMAGHMSAVEALLQGGALVDDRVNQSIRSRKPNSIPGSGFPAGMYGILDDSTALMIACRSGHATIARTLLEHGADLEASNVRGETALHAAAIGGSAECTRVLLDAGADLTVMCVGMSTPLMFAIAHEHETVVVQFCESQNIRTTLDQRAFDIFTALHHAVSQDCRNIVDSLVQAGAEVDSPDILGRTPALWAAMKGNIEIFDLLLRHGADPLKRNSVGHTLLAAAEKYRSRRFANVLASRSCDILCLPKKECAFSQGISDSGIQRQHIDLDLASQCETVFRTCFEEQPTVASKNDPGGRESIAGTTRALDRPPLAVAASEGHWQVVIVLLRQGADPAIRDSNGVSPPVHAAREGHVRALRTLLDAGAKRNEAIFRSAASAGQFEVLQYLCEKNDDITPNELIAAYVQGDQKVREYINEQPLMPKRRSDPVEAQSRPCRPLAPLWDDELHAADEARLKPHNEKRLKFRPPDANPDVLAYLDRITDRQRETAELTSQYHEGTSDRQGKAGERETRYIHRPTEAKYDTGRLTKGVRGPPEEARVFSLSSKVREFWKGSEL